ELYNLKRIALLTAMANGDTEVTLFCLKSAELFMLWQMHLKMFFKHGTAERTSPGELSNLILDTLRRIDQQGSYERSPVIDDRVQINLARVIRNNNWARFGIEAVERTIKSLIKTGQLKEGYRYNTKGKLVPSKHHTVYMRLRGDQAKN